MQDPIMSLRITLERMIKCVLLLFDQKNHLYSGENK